MPGNKKKKRSKKEVLAEIRKTMDSGGTASNAGTPGTAGNTGTTSNAGTAGNAATESKKPAVASAEKPNGGSTSNDKTARRAHVTAALLKVAKQLAWRNPESLQYPFTILMMGYKIYRKKVYLEVMRRFIRYPGSNNLLNYGPSTDASGVRAFYRFDMPMADETSFKVAEELKKAYPDMMFIHPIVILAIGKLLRQEDENGYARGRKLPYKRLKPFLEQMHFEIGAAMGPKEVEVWIDIMDRVLQKFYDDWLDIMPDATRNVMKGARCALFHTTMKSMHNVLRLSRENRK